jgi:hypothetical protein
MEFSSPYNVCFSWVYNLDFHPNGRTKVFEKRLLKIPGIKGQEVR